MIKKAHEDNCARCNWLGREVQRTAQMLGKDTWLLLDGADHYALYTTDTEEEA